MLLIDFEWPVSSSTVQVCRVWQLGCEEQLHVDRNSQANILLVAQFHSGRTSVVSGRTSICLVGKSARRM